MNDLLHRLYLSESMKSPLSSDRRYYADWVTKPKCKICERQLNDPEDPTTKDLGGDCLKCMAEVGDPHAINQMKDLEVKSGREIMANRGSYLEGFMEQGRRYRAEADKALFDMVFHGKGMTVVRGEPFAVQHRRYEAVWGDEDMGVRENKVERYLDEEVVLMGGLTRKWVSPMHSGVPDRIVFIQGDVWFVEVKTNDGRLSPEQIREHQRLKDQGANVTTVYGKTGVDKFMEYFKC